MASCQVVVAVTRASYCSYKDVLKRNLKAYDIPANSLESLAQDRYLWRMHHILWSSVQHLRHHVPTIYVRL